MNSVVSGIRSKENVHEGGILIFTLAFSSTDLHYNLQTFHDDSEY